MGDKQGELFVELTGKYYVMEYYDGIQLFVGATNTGQRYICMLIKNETLYDTFICAPISQSQIQKHVRDEYDLRDMFTNPKPNELFTLKINDYTKTIYEMERFLLDGVPDDMLPESGYRFKGAGVLGRGHDRLYQDDSQTN